MTDHAVKSEFLERVRRSRQQWEAAIAVIPPQDWLKPGFCEDWSLKDILAHISWYEREMVAVLRTRQFGGSPLWELSQQARNAAIHEQNAHRSLDDVLAQAEESFNDLMDRLESLSEHDLNDAVSFPGMPVEWKPWQVLASNTYEHYEEHLPQAKAWLASKPPANL